MGLMDQLKEDKEALAKLEAEEKPDAAIEETPEKVDEVVPEPKPEEKPAEESKPDSAVEEKEKSPAQIRVEKRNKEKLLTDQVAQRDSELASARARIAELERPAVKVEDRDPEPDKSEDPTAHLAWENRQIKQELREVKQDTQAIKQKEASNAIKQSALAEVAAFENDVRAKAPDYDAAKNYYANFEAYIIKRDNPNMAPAALNDAVTLKMMRRLAHFQNEGYENPVEAMYEEAKTLGYRPQQAAVVEEKPLKPDLAQVGKNKARNAGTAGTAGGGGRGEITLQHLALGMTVGEIAKLPKGEAERIIRNQQGA